MPIHNINIHSKSDCRELINRIRETLSAVKPHVLGNITSYPLHFLRNDDAIFGSLTPAILSNGTKYHLLEPHLPAIERILSNYDIALIAGLSNSDINELYLHHIKPLKIPSKRKWVTKLLWIGNNAKTLLDIQKQHGSVWHFIETNLAGSLFNNTHDCYIHPNDAYLLRCFSAGKFKLEGVGYAICCEFFNGIGIDEFKPDRHTIRFLNRVGIVKSQSPNEVRKAGITIAQTLGQPRKFVDSHIWEFCADGKGEICTEKNPKCHLCKLNTEEPRLCTYRGSFTTLSAASSSHEGTNPTQLVPLVGETALEGPGQSDSNLLEKEVEMNLKSAPGIVVNADINDMNQTPYKKGYVANLLIIDMGIDKTELSKILSAYPSHYTGLSRPPKSGSKKSGQVPIILTLKTQHYRAILNKPPKRAGAWISAGPVYDMHGRDVKLAGCLNKANFPVKPWTRHALTLNLPRRPVRRLQQVKFMVQETAWTLLSHPPHPRATQPSKPPNLDK
jgi:hypothetical protein